MAHQQPADPRWNPKYATVYKILVWERVEHNSNDSKEEIKAQSEWRSWHGFVYKLGLNRLPSDEPFDASDSCGGGALYSTFYPHEWLPYGCYLATCSIPADAKVVEVCGDSGDPRKKIKSDQLFVHSVVEAPPELCLAAAQQNGYAIQFVPDDKKSLEVCLGAVRQNGCALRDVPDNKKSLKVCLAAVRQNGLAFEFVPDKKRSLKVCLAAFRQIWNSP